MTAYQLRDLVLAHLLESADADGPWSRSTPGIARALDRGDGAMAGRISLLAALSELERADLVEESVRRVDRVDERRKVYSLTDAGRRRATTVLEDASEDRITVVQGNAERTTSVVDAADRFEGGSVVAVLAALDGQGRLHLDEPTEGRFADREAATATLRAALEAVREGSTRTVVVQGAEGIGKTALVEEFCRRIDGTGVTLATGTCDRPGTVPYRPFREAFDDLDLGPAEVSLFDRSDDRTGIPDDKAALDARRRAAFHEVGRTLARRASDAPVVVFLDDLQWADTASLRLLRHLLTSIGDAPVMFVLAYRGEDVPDDHQVRAVLDDASDPRTDRIDLEPLDRDDTGAVVQWLVGRRDVPDSFVDLVYDRTGGNPLFVTESLAQAREQGQVDPDHGVYPDPETGMEVPDRITETVDARLRGLDTTARDVLALGAVVGETIPRPVLAAATDVPGPDLFEYVDLLVRRRIWTRADGGTAFQFTSGVLRDVVRSRMGDDECRRRHRTVAESILDVYDSHEDWYAEVARHFAAAGDDEAAMTHYRDAGDRALETFATDLAVDHYEAALEIARDLDRSEMVLATLEAIGDVTQLTGDYDHAERRFQYVRDRSDDPATDRRMCVNLGRIALHRGDHDETVEYAESGLESADDADPDETHCDLLSMKGWAHLQSSRFDEAVDAFERERELAAAVGTDTAVAQAVHDLGTVRLKRGEWDAAIPLLEDAVERHERAANDLQVTNSLNNLGVVYWKCGDLDSAADCFERALDAQRAIGDRRGVMTSTTNLGLLHHERGDLDGAVENYERALSTAREIGDKRAIVTLLGNLSSIALSQLRLEDASESIDRAVETAEGIGNRTGLATALGNRVRAAFFRDDQATARDAAERRLQVAGDIGDSASTAAAHASMGLIHREAGEVDLAVDRHRRRVDLGTENGHPKQVVRGRLALARDYLASGDPDAAREQLELATDRVDEDSRSSTAILVTLVEGRTLVLDGDPGAAVDRLRTALDDAENLGHRVLAVRIRHRLALALAAAGDPGEATTVARTALDHAEQAGATLFVRRLRAALEEIENDDPSP